MSGRVPPWRRLGWRLGGSLVLLTALGILASGFLQYRAQDQALRASLGASLVNIARTGALLIDPALQEEVTATGAADSEAYRRVRAALAAIQDANGLETPIYTLSAFDAEARHARFVVTSRGPGAPGERYPLVPALVEPLGRAFREGVATHTGIYENQSGTWITAFAPVRDAGDRVVAVLDVDYRVDVYLRELAAVRRRFYIHSLVGGGLALLAGVILARQVTRPVVQLAALARAVVEGDLSARVRVAARDEIGLLANVLYLMVDRLDASRRSMLDIVVRGLEARGGESGSLARLARAALALGDRLGLSPAQREALELGALLHDVGEIRISEAILTKPGALTAEERHLVEQHPAHGVELVEPVPSLTPALDVVGGHHERYDGGGYPQGLQGEEIPLAARIFAVVDTLDAVTHDRPYRPAVSLAEALAVVRREAGKQFDPRVVDAALAIPAERWAELLEVRS